MPSLKDFAVQFAERLVLHESSPTVESDIIKEIKKLTYTKNGNRLSSSDIDIITEEMERYFSAKTENPVGGFLNEAEDSSRFIAMIKKIQEGAKKQ